FRDFAEKDAEVILAAVLPTVVIRHVHAIGLRCRRHRLILLSGKGVAYSAISPACSCAARCQSSAISSALLSVGQQAPTKPNRSASRNSTPRAFRISAVCWTRLSIVVAIVSSSCAPFAEACGRAVVRPTSLLSHRILQSQWLSPDF